MLYVNNFSLLTLLWDKTCGDANLDRLLDTFLTLAMGIMCEEARNEHSKMEAHFIPMGLYHHMQVNQNNST